MTLLYEIQEILLDSSKPLAPALLKLRFLAAKLGSDELEAWVRHELDGYGGIDDVPDYRVTPLMFFGTFQNMVHRLVDQQIPPYFIQEYVSDAWLSFTIREGMATIDKRVSEGGKDDRFTIDVSNFILLLQGKIYEHMVLQSVKATFGIGSLINIQSTVRSRLLDFTLGLEKRLPAAAEISVGKPALVMNDREKANVTQVFNQTIHGNVTNIASSGDQASISVNVVQGDVASLERALAALGLAPNDAQELAQIAAEEKPEVAGKKFGARAAEWIGKRLSAGADGVMKIGGKVLEDDIATAIQGYYDQLPPLG